MDHSIGSESPSPEQIKRLEAQVHSGKFVLGPTPYSHYHGTLPR